MNEHDRFPRTLEEAFGPGHRGGLWTKPDPMHTHDQIVVAGCLLGVVGLVILALLGVL